MWRNREIQILLLILSLSTIIGTGIAAYLFSIQAALYTFFLSVFLITCFLFFTAWRYREIEKLSSYLRQISHGDHQLDIRDNHEGELSILKNDIFKVTNMLVEHHSLLHDEKIKLTEAISDISHQLKTPLTSMTVMVDLLSDSSLDQSKRQEFTHHMSVQMERLDWLVSSLLKLSKIEAGTVRFKQEKIGVSDLLQKATQSIAIPMDIKQQTLILSGDETACFYGDINWTVEALINILKNGVEHTPEHGTITISYSENVLYTEMNISDNGNGISKQDLPYIFKRFYKGKNAGLDSVGIGLAMAHTIIKEQNGAISVKSEAGRGTQFQIKFYKQVV
ncbi:HAMP domain-containing sensor histidine kinase [Pullulanibacillus sp. KACC 23026]|uniref:sensor histidine kinase n=1 Tax=Pullulanibacillus sp. KACC 23026 TaxID=3028315 RepID=UPI0023B04899|nr:HAMP domain-containing sensor histidine kinase [Pullulanibacillus sp. KACC 23026]WEG10941.1 HAMP domain-containing sensor histidine kinase [Pullulanibacillus sp. KACC 23026]